MTSSTFIRVVVDLVAERRFRMKRYFLSPGLVVAFVLILVFGATASAGEALGEKLAHML